MKKLFLSLVAMMIATVSFAQTSLLATLSHDGTISTFYGTNALKEALAKADHGDAITLSAGQFQAANITKAITLRGAGMSLRNDSINSHEATYIHGDFEVNITDSVSDRLTMEGVWFQSQMQYKSHIYNPLFMKCRFNFIKGNGQLTNATFIHCRIAWYITLNTGSSANLINCVVWNPDNAAFEGSSFQFENCVIGFKDTKTNGVVRCAGCVSYSSYKNCVIWNGHWAGSSWREYAITSSCVANKCLGICPEDRTDDGPGNLFVNIADKNNTNKRVTSKIFKDGSIDYTDYLTFSLTDEAKTKYLGTDGKEIGIHGGNLPYEEDPTTPQITKCNVAAKSTADGKLSVDIEVKAAEY